jgi:hypothetical protein
MTHPSDGLWRLAGGAALAGVLMFSIPSRRRRWIPMLILLWGVIAAAGTIGCGGNGSSPIVGQGTPATTAGSYIFTVAGTDSINSKITSSTTVTIIVN